MLSFFLEKTRYAKHIVLADYANISETEQFKTLNELIKADLTKNQFQKSDSVG